MTLLEERQRLEGRRGLRQRLEGRRERHQHEGRHEQHEGHGEDEEQHERRHGLRERRADRHLTRLPRRRLAGLLALGVAVGAVSGYALGLQTRSRAVSREAAGVHATAECTSAVARANTTLAWAVKMGRAFVQQTQVVNQLARGQASVSEALRADQAPSAEGAAAISKFNDALADYLRVVDSCQLESG